MRPSLTRYGDQAPKFWMRPTVHLGGVDVDPVVGERRVLGNDQGHGQEVAEGEAVRPRARTSSGTGGSMARSSWGKGIDEMTWSAG